MPKRPPEPLVEIVDDHDRALGREVDFYEYLKSRRRRWTDAELVKLAGGGHLPAGVELLFAAVRDLRRESLSPEIAAWLIALLECILSDPELIGRVAAPRPHGGRRPAGDLADVDDREQWKAYIVAEVDRRVANPQRRLTIDAVCDDVALLVRTQARPHGMRAPHGRTVKKWYYAAKKGT